VSRDRCSYIVCATPRSGSTLLCQALAATGLAGRPEEYFEARRATGAPRSAADYFEGAAFELGRVPRPAVPEYSSLAGIEDYRDHLAAVLERGTGPNGVFGAKLMWAHVDDFTALARTLPELEHADLGEILAALVGEVDYVWVRRRDEVRQAVSLWRAIQTQAWRSDGGRPERPARYSFHAIDHLLNRLRADDRAWQRYFGRQSVVPLEIVYEDMAEDLAGSVRAVLRRIGIDCAGVEVATPELRRQADERSEEWVERYRGEASVPAATATPAGTL